MARARNIKPGFFTNDMLAEIEPLGRLLFIGMWTIADREGRLEDRPKRIRAEVLPYDDCDVDGLLNELKQNGFIIRYEVGGNRFIQIVNFVKHQNPHVKESASTIPAPDKHSASTVQDTTSTGTSHADSPIPHTDSGFPHTSTEPPADEGGYTTEFEQAWAQYPTRPGSSKKESFKAWKARIKAGVSADDMIAGVVRYAAYVAASKTDPQYIKQPATFFGPGDHYTSDWKVPASARASPKPYESEKDRSRREAAEKLTGRNHEQRNEIIDITPGHPDEVG